MRCKLYESPYAFWMTTKKLLSENSYHFVRLQLSVLYSYDISIVFPRRTESAIAVIVKAGGRHVNLISMRLLTLLYSRCCLFGIKPIAVVMLKSNLVQPHYVSDMNPNLFSLNIVFKSRCLDR